MIKAIKNTIAIVISGIVLSCTLLLAIIENGETLPSKTYLICKEQKSFTTYQNKMVGLMRESNYEITIHLLNDVWLDGCYYSVVQGDTLAFCDSCYIPTEEQLERIRTRELKQLIK